MHVGDFNQLQELHVNGASVTNGSLTGLKSAKSLLKVGLGNNPLVTDIGLKNLRKCRDLVYLNFNGIQLISDYTLKGFSKHTKLEVLQINDATCTLDGINKFKKAVPACRVQFRNQEY